MTSSRAPGAPRHARHVSSCQCAPPVRAPCRRVAVSRWRCALRCSYWQRRSSPPHRSHRRASARPPPRALTSSPTSCPSPPAPPRRAAPRGRRVSAPCADGSPPPHLLRFAQVSVAQYFAVDYHNVYKYVTDTRGATPRTYVLYQARLAAQRKPSRGRPLRLPRAPGRRIAARAPHTREATSYLRRVPLARGGGAVMAPLRDATSAPLTLSPPRSAAPRLPARPRCWLRTPTTTPATRSSSRRAFYACVQAGPT